MDTTLGQTFSAGVPHELFRVANAGGRDAHPDGQRFLIGQFAGSNTDHPITVVLNWWVELEK